MECVSLDQHAFQIQLANQLPENRPLVVAGGGVEGLADRHSQSGRIQRDLGNECGTSAGRWLNRASQELANRFAEAQGLHTPADRDPLHHLGFGRSSSHGSQRTGLPRPPDGRSSGTRNPMVVAAAPGPMPRSGRCGGGWQIAPDPASSGIH